MQLFNPEAFEQIPGQTAMSTDPPKGPTMPDVMFSRFTVEIELGNDAMQDGPDVAAALRQIADRIEYGLEARGKIRDENGNTVGEFRAA